MGQVRGVLAEKVVISTTQDPYMSLRALASYSSLSVRKLRDHLADPGHPLPHYRVGGKVLVRRSEFDSWIAKYRDMGQADVRRLVDELIREVRRQVGWTVTTLHVGPCSVSPKVWAADLSGFQWTRASGGPLCKRLVVDTITIL